ncbi:hypothetical protein VTJ49DRAFT_7518 [Mycothermus thermophilus]|uniref:Uncharacterized protein n=1 Tax=Humicola insolens TaxID=85995 RepID=A0ABR3VQ61_HUMIN
MQRYGIARIMAFIANMDNDTRGWVLCAFSGLACILGATVICVDIPIRLLPGKHHFSIQESNVFLASSLSLSFGVMIFSALYSMLPSAMRYLARDGWDEHKAGFIAMAWFVAGFFGIQVVSRVLHRYMPSHVVDCEHTHDNIDEELGDHHHHHHHHRSPALTQKPTDVPTADNPGMIEVDHPVTERTPLIAAEIPANGHVHTDLVNASDSTPAAEAVTRFQGPNRASTQIKRPMNIKSRVLSFFKDTKPNCDEDGPCFGYTDPCGQECFKHLGARAVLARSATLPILTDGCGDACDSALLTPRYRIVRTHSHTHEDHGHGNGHDHAHHHHPHTDAHDDAHSTCSDLEAQQQPQPQHHHHVPTNGFLSIGLQTVIAIALHKFPEGFVTYATNHANPTLGFNVFMALFVHNIAEGFSMALPLYMALGSRVRAVLWSSLLGGLSQPLGAAVAVAWLKLADGEGFGKGGEKVVVNNTAYAVLFALTAGIMVSVALQLFAESLSLNHSRNLSVFFAFLGMTILGLSNALVSH